MINPQKKARVTHTGNWSTYHSLTVLLLSLDPPIDHTSLVNKKKAEEAFRIESEDSGSNKSIPDIKNVAVENEKEEEENEPKPKSKFKPEEGKAEESLQQSPTEEAKVPTEESKQPVEESKEVVEESKEPAKETKESAEAKSPEDAEAKEATPPKEESKESEQKAKEDSVTNKKEDPKAADTNKRKEEDPGEDSAFTDPFCIDESD